jgi:alkaline phosphatase D
MKTFYEHMPLERRPRLSKLNSSLQIYDQFQFGRQLNLMLMDTRQYRTDQPCGQAFPADDDCADRHDPTATMLGKKQETWLKRTLRKSDAQWNLLAQQTWFSEFRYPQDRFNMDQWDGYTAQRGRLIDELANPNLNNPVILSGDWHCGAAFDVLKDFSEPDSEKVAAELAVTSISSPCLWSSEAAAAVPGNAHSKYYGGDQRGYLWCEISSENMVAENRVVRAPNRADSKVVNDGSLRVEAGKRGFDSH